MFRLEGFAQATQPLVLSSQSVFQALIFFSVTVFKMEIISQSVLTWLEYYCFFFGAKSEMQ